MKTDMPSDRDTVRREAQLDTIGEICLQARARPLVTLDFVTHLATMVGACKDHELWWYDMAAFEAHLLAAGERT